ncbi:putative flavodoxin (plasmid) [Gordonia polyisoprenivorans VH2]|uniref:Putative flavodoxin n=1 Tax=Gordonia polyisoprenivorans (strain DSM 44266 / VH2) TaxID=1112204 RepID=H6N516_GORPV|nr:putative flavodoxin [Gordonia polyisoprenivorans]AFA76061.1 putative flavodoxin [Gordonia polyisoprenivorans VH2]
MGAVISDVLHARSLTPQEVGAAELADADLVGFGSGIYFMRFDQALLDCVSRLPDMAGKRAFVFGTSGLVGSGPKVSR